jgi:hypothetical protein
MPREVGRIENQQHGIRPLDAFHLAKQDVVGHAFVFRARIQAIHARQIHQINFAAAFELGASHTVFYSHTGEVRDLLAQSCEAVE